MQCVQNKVIYKNDSNKCFYKFQKDSMKNIKTTSVFTTSMSYNLKHNVEEIYIDFSDVRGFYPNTSVVIGGLVDLYKTKFKIFKIENCDCEFINETKINAPIIPSIFQGEFSCIDKLVKFDCAKDVQIYSELFTKQLSKELYFESGTLIGLSWCINEIMDNVLNHSEVKFGFILTQVHKHKKSICVSIYDYGRGIFNSFKGSKYEPKSNLDAITMAIKKGVTRDNVLGQGNGLWGLTSIIEHNGGALTITSGKSSLILTHNDGDNLEYQTKHFDKIPYPSKINRSVLINFTISYENPVDLNVILDGYEPFELFQRNIEDSELDNGDILYDVISISEGTGTRPAGRKVRNFILNVLTVSNQKIVLDFSNVSIVTSSFADEFIGKLIAKIGFVEYNNYISLVNCNDFVSKIINKAIVERMQNFEHNVN